MNNDHYRYDQLKKVIQAANPEIMELKFGCEVISGKTRLTVVSQYGKEAMLWDFKLDQPYHNSGSTIYDKILGRPIRLADVLLAISQKSPKTCHIDEDGAMYYGLDNTFGASWNLKDDNLDHQSEETKQFLIDLLATPKESLT